MSNPEEPLPIPPRLEIQVVIKDPMNGTECSGTTSVYMVGSPPFFYRYKMTDVVTACLKLIHDSYVRQGEQLA